MRGPVVYCLSPERNKGRINGMDLSKIRIDPTSLEGPSGDDAIRPEGLKCAVQAWSADRDLDQPADLDLHLKEFLDPTGEAIYFIPSKDLAVQDELIF